MNLKKNNGFVGVDISVALIILLILVPTITGMIYNINKKNNSMKRQAQATNIAVNVMESAKGINIEDLTVEALNEEICNLYSSDNANVLEINNVSYKLEITVTDYSETNTNAEPNKVKTVKAIVTYQVGGKEEQVELSTVIT